MSLQALEAVELTEGQFNQISELVKRLCGINLHDGKKELVKARLSKRLRSLNMRSFNQYLEFIASENGPAEVAAMLDAVSTNLTFFFRESGHLDYLRDHILPSLSRTEKKIRIWSAGCSSGEEPYSIGMTLCDALKDIGLWDAKILATDLSTRVLSACRQGVYAQERFRQTPSRLIGEYFECIQPRPPRQYRVGPALRRLVTFARLNLMENWPMKGPFDVIFCRNVMIYFDKPTQARLVERFYDILAKGGILMIGHSESLTGVKHRFQYVQPTIYKKL
ncbi:MAG: protein-glutamate O-methyltransferase CheR [Planctomycetes bacterium]|jgi:chemotaxis protein methyltransferase CheR|nr:protein-glutamate O-methyltransferase CheR [Planctomycetota bacterium]